jgi:hypothetical protein
MRKHDGERIFGLKVLWLGSLMVKAGFITCAMAWTWTWALDVEDQDTLSTWRPRPPGNGTE